MRTRISLAAIIVAAIMAFALPSAAVAAKSAFRPNIGKAMGLVPPPGVDDPAVGSNLEGVYHGGSVMDTGTVTIHTIFWAPSGYQFSGPPTSGTLGYEPLVQQFFTDVAHDSGSTTNVFSLLDQYGDDAAPGKYSLAYNAATDSIDDTDPYPAKADQCPSASGTATCVTDQEVSDEVDHIIQTTDPSGYGLHDVWEVFLPPDVDECITAGECGTNAFGAYHSLADAGHGTFIYAVMIDTIIEQFPIAGEDPEGNPDAENTIDSAAHETFEAITDPEGVGWMDPNGNELADKCEDGPQQGTPLGYAPDGSPYDQLINGHEYDIQEMWSNATTGCEQSSTATQDGLPLAQVSLRQFDPDVSGNIGSGNAGVRVRVELTRGSDLVAEALASTNARGAWGPVVLRGPHGEVHAPGDDREIVTVQYGAGGPAPDLIATGSGGSPFAEAGWTGWFDLDAGVEVTPGSVTVGPCFQTGVLTVSVGSRRIPLTPECGTASGVSSVPATVSDASRVSLTSNDNRAVAPLEPPYSALINPLGALVSLTVPVGEPDSVTALTSGQLNAHARAGATLEPGGFPTCTAELRLQITQCSGLVPGHRYTLTRSRGNAVSHAKAKATGFARFGALQLRGGDVLSLTNSAGRTLTKLHVAHLRVAITGNETRITSGRCQAGDYWGPPLTGIPASPTVGAGGATGLGRVCPNSGQARGLPATPIEQVDDLSGGATETSVPELNGTAPSNNAIVYGGFRAMAETSVTGAEKAVYLTGAHVALTITPAGSKRAVFHAANVAGARGVSVGGLAAGLYDAKWVVLDLNGDTRTVMTRFQVAG
jgi:hypothetical protein